jgi:hypothetical protein
MPHPMAHRPHSVLVTIMPVSAYPIECADKSNKG